MPTTLRATSKTSYSKVKNTTLWVIQFFAAALFILSGTNKLAGNLQMVQLFEAIGVGQWFRYTTGTIEVISAFLLMIPPFAAVGASLLACTMAGAVLTHMYIIGGSPVLPLVLLFLMLIVAYGRRDKNYV